MAFGSVLFGAFSARLATPLSVLFFISLQFTRSFTADGMKVDAESIINPAGGLHAAERSLRLLEMHLDYLKDNLLSRGLLGC